MVKCAKNKLIVLREVSYMVESTEFVAFFSGIGYARKKYQDLQKSIFELYDVHKIIKYGNRKEKI